MLLKECPLNMLIDSIKWQWNSFFGNNYFHPCYCQRFECGWSACSFISLTRGSFLLLGAKPEFFWLGRGGGGVLSYTHALFDEYLLKL